jgi:hypothetical protein
MKQREHEVPKIPNFAAKLPKLSTEATLFAVAACQGISEKIWAVFGHRARGGLKDCRQVNHQSCK